MVGLSATGETAVLAPLTAVAYVSLHTADPGVAGANEVAGGAYARQGTVAFANAGIEPDGGVEHRHRYLSAGDGRLGADYSFRRLD